MKAERIAKELKAALDAQKMESESFLNELSLMEKSFSESQQQNTMLLQSLAEKEHALTRMMSEVKWKKNIDAHFVEHSNDSNADFDPR